ncbi:MAG: hypothetical protein LBM06_08735 [Prevotellaceae bacterium]|nr:hypothetical protein [Prevotellaceae bacterium]
MKRFSVLTMSVLAALALASCQNDETLEQAPAGKGKLSIVLEGNQTRTVGTAVPATENAIQTVAVGVFNKDGGLNAFAEYEKSELIAAGTSLKTKQLLCSTGDNLSVIVVANLPKGSFASVASKSDFIGVTAALTQTLLNDASPAVAQSYQTALWLPMSGMGTTKLDNGADQTVAIEVKRLVARVSLSEVLVSFDPKTSVKNDKFQLTDVFLSNVASTSNVQPDVAVFPTTGTLIGGADDKGVPTNKTWLLHSITSPATGGTSANLLGTNKYWFYVFANSDATPTKLVLKGKYYAGGGSSSETLYYPVVLNKLAPGTEIRDASGAITAPSAGKGDGKVYRNATYNVSVTIKNVGTDDPEETIDPAYLTTTVTVADWSLNLDQKVTFQ